MANIARLKWEKEQAGCYWTMLTYHDRRYYGGVTRDESCWYWWIELAGWVPDHLVVKLSGYKPNMREAQAAVQAALLTLRAGYEAAKYRIEHPESH